MNIDEFEAQARDSLERALNRLQTAISLLAALEMQILESGNTIQDLSRVVEAFISQQRESGSDSRSD